MDPITEHFFLEELLSLCGMALVHAAALETAMSAWIAADDARIGLLERRPSVEPLDLMGHDREYRNQVRTRVDAQSEIFLRLESYLSVHGRIAEVFKTNKPSVYRNRALKLSQLLKQPPEVWEADYRVRSAWMHFDEYLDDHAKASAQPPNPQRVCRATDLLLAPDRLTLRLITVEDCAVRLPKVDRVELRPMFERARVLRDAVTARIEDWGTRHA